MNFEINIKGREIKPRVINIKQFSAGVDRLIFKGADWIVNGDKFYVIDDNNKAAVDSCENGVIVWTITKGFTSEAGTKEIQLRCENGERVWLSDKMILIVSESLEGSEGETESKGDSSFIESIPEMLGGIGETIEGTAVLLENNQNF